MSQAMLDREELGERLVLGTPRAGGIELAIERRTLDGWRLLRRIVVRPEELEPMRNALGGSAAEPVSQ